jgi:two-component system, LytTR family, sensor kinase
MLGASNARDPLLINTVGHSIGLLLFAVLVALLLLDGRRNGIKKTGLSLTAASLALLWNLGSLLVLASAANSDKTLEALVTFSFSVLSVLPAVLLNVVLEGRQKAIVISGYALSGTAVALHLCELNLASFRFREWALQVVSFGFAALLGLAILILLRSKRAQPGFQGQLISLGCLLLFALSFLHFGYGHPASAWTAEVTWHHAGIPLILIVLLQDYRFLLLDVFFRFLLNFGMAAAFALAVLLTGLRLHLWSKIARDEFWTGIAIVIVCVSLIVFAELRRRLQSWLTLALFQRNSLDACAHRLVADLTVAQSEQEMLDVAAAAMLQCMGASQVSVENARDFPARQFTQPVVAGTQARDGFTNDRAWVNVIVPLRLSQGESYCILLGSRRGGRRYLSEDLEVLRRLSTMAVEQVERFRHQTLEKLVAQAELRALQSQINPHFLFNALNTLYGTIDRTSRQARQTVLNLSEIFRYVLQTERQFIELEEELRIVRAYLDIEKLRLGDRLEVCWSVSELSKSVLIPVLSIQPIVENAVKHGISAKKGKGVVRLSVESFPGGISIRVEDTGSGFRKDGNAGFGAGVGLENVRQRLNLCYGKAAELKIQSSDKGSIVSFCVPASPPKTEPFRPTEEPVRSTAAAIHSA